MTRITIGNGFAKLAARRSEAATSYSHHPSRFAYLIISPALFGGAFVRHWAGKLNRGQTGRPIIPRCKKECLILKNSPGLPLVPLGRDPLLWGIGIHPASAADRQPTQALSQRSSARISPTPPPGPDLFRRVFPMPEPLDSCPPRGYDKTFSCRVARGLHGVCQATNQQAEKSCGRELRITAVIFSERRMPGGQIDLA
mgnify:FL=1